jgi:hypothetical protein
MELFLNLVWVLVVVASLIYYRRRHPAAVPHRRIACRSAIALFCALAILFPVISLTDDLHAEQAVMEDSSSSRKALKAGAAGDRSPSTVRFHNLPAELFPALPHHGASVSVGAVASPVLSILSHFGHRLGLSRAPPLNEVRP